MVKKYRAQCESTRGELHLMWSQEGVEVGVGNDGTVFPEKSQKIS